MNPDGTVILNVMMTSSVDILLNVDSAGLLRTRPDLPVPCRTDSENGTEKEQLPHS